MNLLQNNIEYFNKTYLAENILKQCLVKGSFPNSSFKKATIIKEMESIISKKISINNANEKTDYKFIGEVLTTSRFAEISGLISTIFMNCEIPNKITASVAKISGNLHRDITLHLNITGNPFTHQFDIKAGNNAMKPFSNVVADAPYTYNGIPYAIINNNPVDLDTVQTIRVATFANLENTYIKQQWKLVFIKNAYFYYAWQA